jgi:hypothetical protein
VSPALEVSVECTVEALLAGVGVFFSVGLTESDVAEKKAESKAPSEESTRVAREGIAVAPRELDASAGVGDGMCAGTKAAVNCAAAARGATASAIVATLTNQVLTMLPPVTFRCWPGVGAGISGAM